MRCNWDKIRRMVASVAGNDRGVDAMMASGAREKRMAMRSNGLRWCDSTLHRSATLMFFFHHPAAQRDNTPRAGAADTGGNRLPFISCRQHQPSAAISICKPLNYRCNASGTSRNLTSFFLFLQGVLPGHLTRASEWCSSRMFVTNRCVR